ncbi:MAG: histidinol phosphatase [Acidobacteriota bacterium]
MTRIKRAVCETVLFALTLSTTSIAARQRSGKLAPGRKYTTIERLKPQHLRAVRADRVRFASERRPVSVKTGLNEYRAVLHAHAEDATHTGGTRPELLAAARRAGVQIVMLTDHIRPNRDFIDDSWRGVRDGVLFIPGAEDRGFLSFPINSLKEGKADSREQYIELVRGGGGNIFLSHVEERLDWPADKLDGLEIYNHHTDIKDEGAFNLWLRGTLTDPMRLPELAAALNDYPEEVFGAQQDYLEGIIAKWDSDSQTHPLTGVAANDCHHNQVFTVTAIDEATVEVGYITSKPTTTRVTADKVPGVAELVRGRKPGELIARLDFDPYERSLRYVSTHILARELTEAAIREALKRGHAFVAHDWLCDSTGFAFVARNGRKAGVIMGDEVRLGSGLKLIAEAPIKCAMKLIRNGEVIQTSNASRIDFEVKTPGVYRIEAWLEVDGEQRPWIYANPIYVR